MSPTYVTVFLISSCVSKMVGYSLPINMVTRNTYLCKHTILALLRFVSWQIRGITKTRYVNSGYVHYRKRTFKRYLKYPVTYTMNSKIIQLK